QGPHHSAQKSTMTGLSDLRTWASNSASVTAAMLATAFLSGRRRRLCRRCRALVSGLSQHHAGDNLFPAWCPAGSVRGRSASDRAGSGLDGLAGLPDRLDGVLEGARGRGPVVELGEVALGVEGGRA